MDDVTVKDIRIDNPEFTFIFTVNLDGKIDIYDDIEKRAIESGTDAPSDFGDKPIYKANRAMRREEIELPITMDKYLDEKYKYFSNLIGTCPNCNVQPFIIRDLYFEGNEGEGPLKEEDVIRKVDPAVARAEVKYHPAEKTITVSLGTDKEIIIFLETKKIRIQRLSELEVKNAKKHLQPKIHAVIDAALQESRSCIFAYKKMKEEGLAPFVDNTFLEKAVLGSWSLSSDYLDENVLWTYGLSSQQKKEFPSLVTFYLKAKDRGYTICKNSEEIGLEVSADLKLFSTGSISIKITIKFNHHDRDCMVALDPYDLIKLIEFPNLVAEEEREVDSERDGEKKTGVLNRIAYYVANATFNQFFVCLSRRENRGKASILRIQRIVTKEPPSRYEIVKRFDSVKYTDEKSHILKSGLYVSPYIGVKIYDNPVGFIDRNTSEYNDLAGRVFLAISTQTKEFLTDLRKGSSYLEKNSLTRGNKDAMLIERRGFVAAGTRSKSGKEVSLDRPYNTLMFCIETIMATWKSVNSFNKELEEYVSRKVNSILNMEGALRDLDSFASFAKDHQNDYTLSNMYTLRFINLIKFRRIKRIFYCTLKPMIKYFIFFSEVTKLRLTVNKARTLSPCEDYSSNIVPHIMSEIAIKGSRKLLDFGMNTLIKTVHDRLENYGHFLKTCHEHLRVQTMILLAIIGTIAGIIGLLLAFLGIRN